MEITNPHCPFTVTEKQFNYFCFWLIIPFSSLAIHNTLPIAPTAVLFAVATTLLVLYTPRISNSQVLILPAVAIAYYFVTQVVIGAPFNRFMGVVLAISYFIVVAGFGQRLSSQTRLKLENKFIVFSTVLLIAECIWRLSHPEEIYQQFAGTGDPRWIYQYKIASFMYGDSNAVAIHIIILLFFVIYKEHTKAEKWPVTKIILAILLVLTISRAAWVGAVIGFVYYRFLLNKKALFYLVTLAFLMVIFSLVYVFYIGPRLENDLSFQSKFEIINYFINYLKGANWIEMLFGIGFSNSLSRLGAYAHNFFIIFFVESGAIGLTFIIMVFLQFIRTIGKNAMIIMVPFVITTTSSSIMFIPYLYVVMALMYLDRKDRQAKTPEAL